MPDATRYAAVAVIAALGLVPAAATDAAAAGKIVCWKDASGKTVGCGDTVPPEYRGAATKELDSRGVVRKTTETAEEIAKRREREKEEAQARAEEERIAEERRRSDRALIATFSSAGEIDAKRDRDLQTIDLLIKQQRNQLQLLSKRHADLEARKAGMEKANQKVPPALAEDIDRAAAEKRDMEESIAAKEREKVELRRKYGEMKARYTQLRGGSAQ